jgi:hypothetical protein
MAEFGLKTFVADAGAATPHLILKWTTKQHQETDWQDGNGVEPRGG